MKESLNNFSTKIKKINNLHRIDRPQHKYNIIIIYIAKGIRYFFDKQ